MPVPPHMIDHPSAADRDPLDFTWGTDCGRFAPSKWCYYQEPHEHGFACDKTCPCKTDQTWWRPDLNHTKDAL